MRTHAPVQLPPGHRPGPLSLRVLAVLVDGTLPSLVVTGWWALVSRGPLTVSHVIVVSVLASIVLLGWGVVVWWSGAQRGATPGMRLLDLGVVDVDDGLPVGWGRFFVRQLVYGLLASTVVGLPLMLTWLVLDPARRGWHDRAGGAVVVQRAAARTEVADPMGDSHRGPRATPVALPAHLQGGVGFRPVDTPGLGVRRPDLRGHARPLERARLGELDWGAGQHTGGSSAWRPPEVAPRAGLAMSPPGAETTLPPPGAEATLPPPGAEATLPSPWVEATLPPPPIASVPLSDPRTAPQAPGGERTVLRPRLAKTSWQILFEDGRTTLLGAGVLLGRRPVADPGEERFGLIAVADAARTMSMTHLLVAVDETGPFITDRGSTHGSGVIGHDGRVIECEPGGTLRVEEGQIVVFGDHRLLVRRGAV